MNFIAKTSQIENFKSCLIAFILIVTSLIFLSPTYNAVQSFDRELNTTLADLVYPFAFIFCLIFLIKPLYNFFLTKTKKYIFADDRLTIQSGIFVKNEDYVEIYRIKDVIVRQPFYLKPLNAYDITLLTTDISHPQVHMRNVIGFK